MNEPAIPIALVARHPPGCLPGTINLASAPTISPMIKAPSRWNSITHRLFGNPRLVNHSRRFAAGLSVGRRRSTVQRLAFRVWRSTFGVRRLRLYRRYGRDLSRPRPPPPLKGKLRLSATDDATIARRTLNLHGRRLTVDGKRRREAADCKSALDDTLTTGYQ
jgi:hypothetical protein